MQKIKKYISILLVFALLIFASLPFSTFAKGLNNAYLTESYWREQDNVEVIDFDFGDDEPQGVLRYTIDDENNTFYVYLSLGNLNEPLNRGATKLHFDIYNDISEYHFSINEDGICDYEGNEDKAFEMISNFENANFGVYLVGIRINNESYINNINLNLNFNGRNYILFTDLVIDSTPTTAYENDLTTLDQKKTTVKDKTTKHNTTKKATKKANSTKSTTKYKPKYNKFSSTIETEISKYYSSNAQQTEDYIDNSEKSYSLSNKSLMMGIMGGVFIALSIVFTIAYIVNSKHSRDEK